MPHVQRWLLRLFIAYIRHIFLFNNYDLLPHLHHRLSMVPSSLCARSGNLVLQTGLLFLTSKQQSYNQIMEIVHLSRVWM